LKDFKSIRNLGYQADVVESQHGAVRLAAAYLTWNLNKMQTGLEILFREGGMAFNCIMCNKYHTPIFGVCSSGAAW